MFNLIEASMIVQKQGLKKSNKAARKLVLVTDKAYPKIKIISLKKYHNSCIGNWFSFNIKKFPK